MDEIKLRVSGIEKSFPGVKALSNINFAVRKELCMLSAVRMERKVHADEGTDGIYKADKGQIYIDEKRWRSKTPFRPESMEFP